MSRGKEQTMNSKAYKLPNGKKVIFEYDITGVGKITLECMDELMSMIADRSQDDTVSRQYLLAEIDDLADEFSELDENGLHSERWCGIMDSRGVIVNTPSVSDRLQGEWVLDPDGMDWNIPAWKCSRCGFVANYIGTEANGFGRNPMNWAGSNFCPNCGADMRSINNYGEVHDE